MTNTTKNSKAHWQVTANGELFSKGTAIRKNGAWSDIELIRNENHESQKNTSRTKVLKEITKIHQDKTNKIVDHVSTSRIEETLLSSKEESDGVESKKSFRKMKIVLNSQKSSRETLSLALKGLNWKELKDYNENKEADIWWYGNINDNSIFLKNGVYAVNRIPGVSELTQKINLSRIIDRMQKLFPADFNFYPATWFLPEQLHQFIGEANQKLKKTRNKKDVYRAYRSTYIVKPNTGSHGDGIYLINNPRDLLITSKSAIVQRYIPDPLLIDGYKFDLRLYLVITRLEPLEIYICKDGLARFCTVKYKLPKSENIGDVYMHLTNYSLNKFSSNFKQTESTNTGSKRSYRSIKLILRRHGYNVHKLHQKIINLCNKVILAMVPDIKVYSSAIGKSQLARSFQVLGFDILLTSDLDPILLEVNASPSLCSGAERETFPGSGVYEAVQSTVDEQIKVPLIQDCLKLIAYGESKFKMKNLCLEKIYPPTRHIVKRMKQQEINCASPPSNKTSVHNNRSKQNISEIPDSNIDSKKEIESNKSFHLPGSQNISTNSQCTVSTTTTTKKPDLLSLYPCCSTCGNYITGEGPSLCQAQDYFNNEISSTVVDTTTHESQFDTDLNNVEFVPKGSEVPTRSPTSDMILSQLRNERFSSSNFCGSQKKKSKNPSRLCDNCRADEYLIYNRNKQEHLEVDPLEEFLSNEEKTNASVRKCAILNRAAEAFIFFSGIKPTLTISPNSFRNMIRRCQLCDSKHLPSIDIIFMEVMRKWQNYVFDKSILANNDSSNSSYGLYSPGIPFQGFIEALLRIAKTYLKGANLTTAVDIMLTTIKAEVKRVQADQRNSVRRLEINKRKAKKQFSKVKYNFVRPVRLYDI